MYNWTFMTVFRFYCVGMISIVAGVLMTYTHLDFRTFLIFLVWFAIVNYIISYEVIRDDHQ